MNSRKRHFGRAFAPALAAGMCCLLAACGASSPAIPTTTVTDVAHRSVRVPTTINRIADQWAAHVIIDELLGRGSAVVAVNSGVQKSHNPLLQEIDPHIAKADAPCTNSGCNAEQMLKDAPDLVFWAGTTTGADSLQQQTGLPVYDLSGFTTFATMEADITATASVLGAAAQTKAAAYNSYLQKQVSDVQAAVKHATEPAPSVLHVLSTSQGELTVDGSGTLIDTWITLAGGTDAAAKAGVKGNMVTINEEELAAMNPDVIIFESGSGNSMAKARADLPGWDSLNAVRDNRVYQDPQGVFPWDRYGPEEALQVQWAAQLLHPSAFPGLTMQSVATDFYQRFFGYRLTPSDLATMFAPLPAG
ncbi:MAG TPA: ABC transporter substrate-binding protein [Amycolatopsis sp.]|jgi:iron complex transport system substrate-binding protein|nr:ABC transporter substrate-binding protein [Amycolatopsis sp.]